MALHQGARRRQPRSFSERKDVLNNLSDAELIKRYRLDREGIVLVTDLVRDALTNATARNKAITPELKVVTLLRYLATGKMQLCTSDDLGLSQPTVSRIITQTLDALSSNDVLCQFIKFPVTPYDTQRKKVEFMEIGDMPDVIGVIDGTHVQIVAPKEYEYAYVSRKGYHSINVQIVFDACYRITDVVAMWPGSVHDARILSESALNNGFETGIVPAGCHLLGDSGYPCKKWLLTPYYRPQPGYQSRYNKAHKKCRSLVERGIGQLKRRFHVLHSEVRVGPPSKVCQIVEVCAMLHNICKDRNIHAPPAEENPEDHDDEQENLEQQGQQAAGRPNEGRLYRDAYARLHFNNDE